MKAIYKKCLTIRSVEEQLLIGYKNRHFGGTVHTCIGQEILPSILSEVLSNNPFIISNHRGHGHFVAHTGHIEGLFCEFLGKKGAPSKGIGGSQHLYAENFLSNGIQGCTSPFSVGIGMVRPTVIYMGDGTMGNGTVYEAINMSKITNSQVMFVVEDNEISQTTPSRKVLSGSISDRYRAFDIFVIEVDSADPVEMHDKLENLEDLWAKNKVVALVVKSYRLNSHSKGDDTRPDDVLSDLPDPVRILSSYLDGDYESDFLEVMSDMSSIWDKCLDYPSETFVPNKGLLNDQSLEIAKTDSCRVNEKIRRGIDESLKDGALFIGEDIITKWSLNDKPYGGAFGVSFGLSDQYDNVIGTSISEPGIVGVAAGRAFASNKLSIAEIMFADFATLIVDQLHNGVDKYKKMFGKSLRIPLVVRLPYGMGRGYGPTHSQSPFELFSGLSEVLSISYTPLIDYAALIKNIKLQGASVIVYEPKLFYGDKIKDWVDLINGFESQVIPGVLVGNFLFTKGVNPKCLVITHGSFVKATLEAVKDISVDIQVLVVNELYSRSNYLDFKLEKDLPLVIVEESNCSYGPLSVSISKELMLKKSSRDVTINKYVDNIPANSGWEQDLMISKKVVTDLIERVLQ